MIYRLKFTNPYGEIYWFCNLGDQVPFMPERRLIARTTDKREHAKEFDSEEEARSVLVTAGRTKGWEVVAE